MVVGDWIFVVDMIGGINFFIFNIGMDNVFFNFDFIGFFVFYIVSNSNKYYFDDVYVGLEIID